MHLAIITKFQVRGSSAAMAALGTLLATTMMHVIATRAPGIAAWPGSRCRLVPDAEPRAPHPGAVRGPKHSTGKRFTRPVGGRYLTELMEGCFRVNPEAANRDVSSGD